MVAQPWPEYLGAQRARIELIPDGEEHPRTQEIREYVARTGTSLDPWQDHILFTSFLMRGDLYAAFKLGLVAPRQNGKNGITEMRELVGAHLLGEKLVIHTAHLADTCKEAFRRLEDIIDANEWLSKDVKHIWRTNGHEAIEFRNGCRIRFRTRTRGGGRGFSAPVVIFDEAMFLPTVSLGAMLPLISAQPNPQVWFVGSAVDQMIMDEGIEFARVREAGIKREDPRLAFFEWSLDFPSPEDVPVGFNPEAVATTNPALGIRISMDYARAEYEALGARTYAVERYCVGDWPATDGLGDMVWSLELWNSLQDSSSKAQDPVVFAFDVSPDRRRSTIAAIGRRSDKHIHIEIPPDCSRKGTDWVPARIAELNERHRPSLIVCDGVGPAFSLTHELRDLGIEVRALTTPEHGEACGLIFDAVEQRRLRHMGTAELNAAVRGATQRPLGDRWAWNRRTSSADITPLVACTLGVWALVAAEQPPGAWYSLG